MITVKDFGKYMKAPIVEYVDNNVAKRLKTGEWNFILKKDKTTTRYTETKQVEDMGSASEMASEYSSQQELSLEEGYAKRRNVIMVGAFIQYTKMHLRLGGAEYIRRCKEGITDSSRKWLESLGAMYFEYADTARSGVPEIQGKPIVDPRCGDGLPIASLNHTFSSSSTETYDTMFEDYRDLDQDAVQDAITAMELWNSNVGERLDVKAKELQVSSTLRWTGAEILESEGRSDTANRTENVIKDEVKLRVLRRIINQNEWRVTNNLTNDLSVEFAWQPEQDMEYIPGKGGKYIHWMDFACGHGCNDPRGCGFWSKY